MQGFGYMLKQNGQITCFALDYCFQEPTRNDWTVTVKVPLFEITILQFQTYLLAGLRDLERAWEPDLWYRNEIHLFRVTLVMMH